MCSFEHPLFRCVHKGRCMLKFPQKCLNEKLCADKSRISKSQRLVSKLASQIFFDCMVFWIFDFCRIWCLEFISYASCILLYHFSRGLWTMDCRSRTIFTFLSLQRGHFLKIRFILTFQCPIGSIPSSALIV